MTICLNNIHIVLVETTLPANIGSVARAMKTMGLNNLHVVNPKHPLDENAFSRAAGAVDLLESITLHDNIESAIKDSHIIWAASGRHRSLPIPLTSLKQACNALAQQNNHLDSEQTQKDIHTPNITILFGREDRGLTNDELSLAHLHVQIPTNDAYGVLNLAAAVQVFCYEIRQCLVEENIHTQDNQTIEYVNRTIWDEPPATQEQVTQLEAEILKLANVTQIFDPENPRTTQKRLKRMLNRIQLDRMEYNFLRALFKKSLLKITDKNK